MTGNNERAALWGIVKAAGADTKPYINYSTDELREIVKTLRPAPVEDQRPPVPRPDIENPFPDDPIVPERDTLGPPPAKPVLSNMPSPDELPGMRKNTHDGLTVLRIDEAGRQWLQEEVRKGAFARPRFRRVLRQRSTNVVQQTVQNGEFTETFEVPGTEERVSEIRVTLPTYQVGRFRHPNHPFTILTYDGREGYDFEEVCRMFGGADLVPMGAQRIYIANQIAFDIRTTVRVIEAEFRKQQMQGLHRPVVPGLPTK